jgi:uracil-DNA glycosylase
MKGFFEIKHRRTKSSKKEGNSLSCASCGLFKEAISPMIQPYGDFKKRILIIGEAPGQTEDERGKPWQGKVGRLLKRTCSELGIDLFKDCVSINAVNCRPPGNKTPTKQQIACCRKVMVEKTIQEYAPDIIILLGGSAINSFFDLRWKKNLGGIMKWRGWTIPDRDYKAWVCPTFHPSYVERMQNDGVTSVWEQDLQQAFSKIGERLPIFQLPKIDIIDDLTVLDDIHPLVDTVAFDYETTGIKPHAKGHRIVSCAVADFEDHAYAFLLPKTREERQPLINLLQNDRITKIAQNMKYEDHWTERRLYTSVNNWGFDPMLSSHILDNREGVCGLKFQAYVNFGIIGYDDEISSYIQSGDKNANAFNKIYELLKIPGGKEKLLTYNGYDAVLTYRLAQLHMEEIEYDFLPF